MCFDEVLTYIKFQGNEKGERPEIYVGRSQAGDIIAGHVHDFKDYLRVCIHASGNLDTRSFRDDKCKYLLR